MTQMIGPLVAMLVGKCVHRWLECL